MNKALNIISKIVKMPPWKVVSKLIGRGRKILLRWRDRVRGSYTGKAFNSGVAGYLPFLSGELDKLLPEDIEQIRCLSGLYLDHYFDLLGSGWVRVEYGMKCRGLEEYRYDMNPEITADIEGAWLASRINRYNLKESRRIWRLIDDKNYTPIDWHLDFKSGYRWRERTWYKDIRYGHKPGVDIKVPWELARMQHLPMLAWAYGVTKKGDETLKSPEVYIKEFRSQVLDFIATNPPRFGVTWFCTMDVGIRVVNWFVAYDLFRSLGAEFDRDFMEVFTKSVYEHGKHCIENLEYSPDCRANHYLSDIAGLLFTAAYLPTGKETKLWLAFAIQELVTEIKFQFNSDGSNFEASTNYHRLSTEIMLYCSMLCLNLTEEKRDALKHYNPKGFKSIPMLKPSGEQEYDVDKPEFFPLWYWERLEKAVEFTTDITKPSGEIPQIGDNDSGRFLKIWPKYSKINAEEAVKTYKNLEGYSNLSQDAVYLDENILDHRHISGIGRELFGGGAFMPACGCETPETMLVKQWLASNNALLCGRAGFAQEIAKGKTVSSKDSPEQWMGNLILQYGKPLTAAFPGNNLKEGIEIYAYPDFGLFIYKSPELYLSVRCGSIGQNGKGGHTHNDQLSIELNINGRDIIRDPGTYLYTPVPDKRDYFRSTKVHFTPFVDGKEQNDLISSFSMRKRSEPEVLFFNKDGFLGKLQTRDGESIYRLIRVTEDTIEIQDFFAGRSAKYEGVPYSSGYGKLL
jgi:hypothetical protein